MATQKLQASRALGVIPSNNSDIPFPALIAEGAATSSGGTTLTDSSADFIAKNIKCGDIIYNITAQISSTVLVVVSSTEIIANAGVFTSGNQYRIFQASPQTGLGNQGCVLYIGTGGSLSVTTSGNDILEFQNVQSGTFFPVNVVKISATGTTASDIIALW